MKKKVGIIGAGPAGLTAAYQIAKEGHEVVVYEASEYSGGLSRSFELWGQIVDVGPHRFFSKDDVINGFWREIIEEDYTTVSRLTRIYYNKKYFYYPLKPLDALLKMGPFKAVACVASYFKEKLFGRNRDCSTFEDWVVSRFGRRLYEIFFKSYSEKLWGISCKELDSDFAAQRIKKFSLGGAILACFKISRKKHKTLVDEFEYPIHGSGYFYDKLVKKLDEFGGSIEFKHRVEGVQVVDGKCHGIVSNEGELIPYDSVISTMPLTLLVLNIQGVPEHVADAARKLRYRNTIIVYIQVDSNDLFEDQWLYIHDDTVGFGRVTNFSNWSEIARKGKKETILALEYWCYQDDEIWRHTDDRILEIAKNEIAQSGIAETERLLDGHVLRIPKSYPVYEVGYDKHVSVIKEYLEGIDRFYAIGRYGAFKYNNQDHSMLMGILAAENICKNKQNDLWSVNTDQEYQESKEIKEEGAEFAEAEVR